VLHDGAALYHNMYVCPPFCHSFIVHVSQRKRLRLLLITILIGIILEINLIPIICSILQWAVSAMHEFCECACIWSFYSYLLVGMVLICSIQRVWSDCKRIEDRLQSDCTAITERVHSDNKAISELLHSDSKRFKAISERFQSYCTAITKRLYSDCRAIAQRF
jgi:hypothetical protein